MLNLTKFINIPVFLMSLAIGIFVVYVSLGDTRKIYVYPTPENVELMQYRDKTNTCFGYTQQEVECPKDPSLITKIPSQA
jgi:hypothetical protein